MQADLGKSVEQLAKILLGQHQNNRDLRARIKSVVSKALSNDPSISPEFRNFVVLTERQRHNFEQMAEKIEIIKDGAFTPLELTAVSESLKQAFHLRTYDGKQLSVISASPEYQDLPFELQADAGRHRRLPHDISVYTNGSSPMQFQAPHKIEKAKEEETSKNTPTAKQTAPWQKPAKQEEKKSVSPSPTAHSSFNERIQQLSIESLKLPTANSGPALWNLAVKLTPGDDFVSNGSKTSTYLGE